MVNILENTLSEMKTLDTEEILKGFRHSVNREPLFEPVFRSKYSGDYQAGICFCLCDCGCDKLIVSPGAIVLGSIGYIIDG